MNELSVTPLKPSTPKILLQNPIGQAIVKQHMKNVSIHANA